MKSLLAAILAALALAASLEQRTVIHFDPARDGPIVHEQRRPASVLSGATLGMPTFGSTSSTLTMSAVPTVCSVTTAPASSGATCSTLVPTSR